MKESQSNLRDFDVLNKLGEGAFGQVFKVKRKKDGKQYALKKVKIGSMKQKQRDNALNQIRILASYDEQYIIGYKDSFYDQVSGSLCVVMEFASQGDILKLNQTHIKNKTKYKQQQIWKALVHMTKGLKSLHDKKILHRDLKCANVFITGDGTYKLGDLNVSKVLKKDMACTQTGTPYYASPQVWKDKPYGAKSDIWSLGCVLYQMCALRPPFTATDLQGLYRKVCAGHFERIPLCYSNDLANMITSLLKVDADKRPNSDQILQNPLVHKKFNGQINIEAEQQVDQLLQTLKYNPKDLKGLRKILPKANYAEDILPQPKKINIDEFRNGISSVKNSRKQPTSQKQQIKRQLQNNQKKLEQFLQRKRQLEQQERLKKLKLVNDQKEDIIKKRERVLSACGVRQPLYHYDSPKIAVHKQSDDTNSVQGSVSVRPTRKDEVKYNPPPMNGPQIKLPPKPQGPGTNNNINYKLPPKPVYGGGSNNVINRSYEQETNRSREKSKENLRNLGAQIVQAKQPIVRPPSSDSHRIQRSSSQQKVVYPSWWG